MGDRIYHALSEKEAILALSSRLKYLLNETYQVTEIESIRVDGDNGKLDVNTSERTFRFKVKGVRHVLVPQLGQPGLTMTLDPALAQGIYNIVEEFGA